MIVTVCWTYLELIELTIAQFERHSAEDIQIEHLKDILRQERIDGQIYAVSGKIGGITHSAVVASREMLNDPSTEGYWCALFQKVSGAGGKFIAVVNVNDQAEAQALQNAICSRSTDALLWTFPS